MGKTPLSPCRGSQRVGHGRATFTSLHGNDIKTMKSVQLKEPEFLSGAPGSPVCTAVGDALSWVVPHPALHLACQFR